MRTLPTDVTPGALRRGLGDVVGIGEKLFSAVIA